MSKRPMSIDRMQNHQWRSQDPLDGQQWARRLGRWPADELYGTPDVLDADRLTLHPMGAISGHPWLEARLHTLVSAMAAFAPPAHGVAAHAVHFGESVTPTIAVHPGMQA